ncbi:MAG: ABC transporter substrate-binding protein [Rhizobiaceae bacterium MnEN-MB40S]|nr:MAG: ABC transporter substrate-binding protein [Rhizobiaceae bacterium MnEN-MB40S]
MKTLITAGCLAIASASAAGAHPHVFAEARLEVIIDDKGGVDQLRHVWRFDELFSSTVMLDFDANADLELADDELAEVGTVIKDSLADYNYFTFVTKDGKEISVTPPDVIHADFQDGQLLLFFAVRPSEKMSLTGDMSFGTYDPTMYTAIEFFNDEDMVIKGDAGACSRKVIRPDADEIIAENQDMLTDAFFNDPAGNDSSKFFATRLQISC